MSLKPYVVIEWNDNEPTGAKGWIVVDKLINKVAGGGLFMHKDATYKEVADLASTMTYKNSLSDTKFGGAKGGIRYDHTKRDSKDVLRRFLFDNKQVIEEIWSTGADLNTFDSDILSIVKNDLGLASPFESLAKMLEEKYSIQSDTENLFKKLSLPLNEYFTLGNAATGFTVSKAIYHLTVRRDLRIAIQGFGKVGSSLAYFINKFNLGLVVGISDINMYISDDNGIDIDKLLAYKLKFDSLVGKGNKNFFHWLYENTNDFNFVLKNDIAEDEDDFLSKYIKNAEPDVFCPCASRYILNERVVGLVWQDNIKYPKYIISGANNIFDKTDSLNYVKERNVVFLPEWVSNSGNSLLYIECLKKSDLSVNWPAEVLAIIEGKIEHFFNELKAQLILKSKGEVHDICNAIIVD